MVQLAKGRFRMVGTVSVAFGCPFEGKVEPGTVMEDVGKFVALGVAHVALGDTTGMATPLSVKKLFLPIQREIPAAIPIAHFHDTRGTGLVNYVAAYEAGVRHFDSSFGGAGGHPAKLKYGGGFTGNVATEDLVSLFESMGIDTGIELDGLLAAAELCEKTLGRELHGRVARSGLNPLAA
jgi:hydroxymethylglutaryl-CoA lyase